MSLLVDPIVDNEAGLVIASPVPGRRKTGVLTPQARFGNWLSRLCKRPSCERLIVFTRYPEPGKTKTRLIDALGPDGAAELQHQMALHTMSAVRRLAQDRGVSLVVCFEGGDESGMRRWLGADLHFQCQSAGDLGDRMAHAFDEAFGAGMERVVVVGTDCPGLTVRLMERAFDELRRRDVVLGPSHDGGYYLIGLRRTIPQLFTEIPWGTHEVLETTRRAAERLGLSIALLEPLDDVDRPEDLPIWEQVKNDSSVPSSSARISVIIPTLDEEANIAEVLPHVKTGRDTEVIVVDGGSTDNTVDVARSHGVNVLIAEPGRARQMNVGAAVAKGDILLFLHADTRLPEQFDEHIRRTLAQLDTVAGAFMFSVDTPSWKLRLVERMVHWRSRARQMPYGDQAIFVRTDIFEEVGGFPDIPIMEDYVFIRKIRRLGRVAIAPAPAVTSARRWMALGVCRTTLINQVCILAYHLGVSPSRIARLYNRSRGQGFVSKPKGF